MDAFCVRQRETALKRLKCLLLGSLLATASLQAGATCYTVFDRYSRVIFQDATPPVDMAQPLHETVPQRFPGGHMIVSNDACGPLPIVTPAVPTGRAPPLLTDRKTAQAMGVAYKVLSGDLVLVEPGQAPPLRPSLSVIPSQSRADGKARAEVVITELRNPPMTIVQTSQQVAASDLKAEVPLRRN